MIKIAMIVLLLLAGCAGAPSREELAAADAGVAPGPEFHDTVRDAVKGRLHEPDQLRNLKVAEPERCKYRNPYAFLYDIKYGFCARIEYDARDNLNGSAIHQRYDVFYHNGKILHYSEVF